MYMIAQDIEDVCSHSNLGLNRAAVCGNSSGLRPRERLANALAAMLDLLAGSDDGSFLQFLAERLAFEGMDESEGESVAVDAMVEGDFGFLLQAPPGGNVIFLARRTRQ